MTKLVTKRDTGHRGVSAQLGMGVRMPAAHVIPASLQLSVREACGKNENPPVSVEVEEA